MMGEKAKLLKKILIEWAWMAVAASGVFLMMFVVAVEAPWYFAFVAGAVAWWLIITGVVRVFPNGVWPFLVKR